MTYDLKTLHRENTLASIPVLEKKKKINRKSKPGENNLVLQEDIVPGHITLFSAYSTKFVDASDEIICVPDE